MELSELLQYHESKTGASVSIEVKHPVFHRCPRLKLSPGQYLHHSDFCRFSKLQGANISCSANKKRSLEVASHGRGFSGCCPHGIWEFAYPVMIENTLGAVIYFGNFRSEKPLKPPGNIRWTGTLPPKITNEKRTLIRKSALFIAEFIAAETGLFIATGGMSGKHHGEDFYIENCHRLIDCHYCRNIALRDLSEMLKVNSNYLGALLKKHTSKTFRELLTERRIKEAQIYLKFHRNFSITKVALLCGFSDSNYFSVVFRRKCGITPGEYRQKQ